MKTFLSLRTAAAAAIAFAVVGHAEPADKAELETLRAQVQQLAQQLKVLQRQLEIKEEAAAAAAPSTPKVTATDKGVSIPSAGHVISAYALGVVVGAPESLLFRCRMYPRAGALL